MLFNASLQRVGRMEGTLALFFVRDLSIIIGFIQVLTIPAFELSARL